MGSCLPKQAESSDVNAKLTGGNAHIITMTESWKQKLAEAESEERIVIAKFSASWCRPCRSISSFYAELAEKHPSLMFLSVDVDELTEFSMLWNIEATPTFFFLRNGQEMDRLVGANKVELQKKINRVLISQSKS
ncbi:hypothetical protein SAY86_007109 [Trapa natans]|uniref:Thioredoxin domain-containing protein n=1 Tax=Trapa natans TaxID=22666 RepID=A0AAN7R078_TRANT|nr:hypothetical protein SAY86_007109 [Trapa natans]